MIFDTTLSPKTSPSRGYEYIDDIYISKGQNRIRELINSLAAHRIRLGLPKRNESSYYGLYIPIT